MAQLTPAQVEAAREFANATLDALRGESGVHPETAISATARMAGSFLFRSFGLALGDAQPGQAVLSDEANRQGPALLAVLGTVLTHLGVVLDREQLATAVGPGNRSQLEFLASQRLLEPAYAAIRERHGLALPAAAEAAAVAAALLVQHSAEALDPHAGFGVAAYGFIEGTKTVPG